MIKKSVNFAKKNEDVLSWANSQANFSEYVIRLIRADMQCQKILTEERIIELIKEYAPTQDNKSENEVMRSLKDTLDL